jgi:hypothetical protein
LNDERAVEHVLKPLGEDEGNHVAEVHRVGRGSTTGVEVEGLLGFVAVEDEVEFAVGAEMGRGKRGFGREGKLVFLDAEGGRRVFLDAEGGRRERGGRGEGRR